MLRVARECGFSVPFSRSPSSSSPTALAAAATVTTTTAETPSVIITSGVDAMSSEQCSLLPERDAMIGDDDPWRGVRGAGQRPWKGGAENVQPVEHAPRNFGHVTEDDGERGMFLPRPGGVSVAATGRRPRYGGSRGGHGRADGLPSHPPPPPGSERAGCDGVGAVGGGTGGNREKQEASGLCEEHQQRAEEEEEVEENESRASSTTSLTSSSLSSSSSSSSSEVESVQSPATTDETTSEQKPPRRLPPAHCRVVVVGAGASGLSAAACLRARGEDRVVVLERCETFVLFCFHPHHRVVVLERCKGKQ